MERYVGWVLVAICLLFTLTHVHSQGMDFLFCFLFRLPRHVVHAGGYSVCGVCGSVCVMMMMRMYVTCIGQFAMKHSFRPPFQRVIPFWDAGAGNSHSAYIGDVHFQRLIFFFLLWHGGC